MAARRIDAHQHFWNLETGEYPWLTPDAGVLYRTFEPSDLEPRLQAAGIDGTVLVQSASSSADTNAMLRQADCHPWIAAVIGWVPLHQPAEASRLLDELVQHPKFRGVRHPMHAEPDPDWVQQPEMLDGLRALADRHLVFELITGVPRHLQHVPLLAEKLPNLTLVIDHLGNPPIATGTLEPWASQIAAASLYPNVFAKVSGLMTIARRADLAPSDLAPYIDHALTSFGADRLMFGSDWPVCLQACDFEGVLAVVRSVLAGHTEDEIDAVLGETAVRVYNL